MDSKYVHVFTGSMIEANRLVSELSQININSIVKDEAKSAILAGFGVPNFLYTHKVFVKNKDLEKSKKIIKNSSFIQNISKKEDQTHLLQQMMEVVLYQA